MLPTIFGHITFLFGSDAEVDKLRNTVMLDQALQYFFQIVRSK